MNIRNYEGDISYVPARSRAYNLKTVISRHLPNAAEHILGPIVDILSRFPVDYVPPNLPKMTPYMENPRGRINEILAAITNPAHRKIGQDIADVVWKFMLLPYDQPTQSIPPEIVLLGSVLNYLIGLPEETISPITPIIVEHADGESMNKTIRQIVKRAVIAGCDEEIAKIAEHSGMEILLITAFTQAMTDEKYRGRNRRVIKIITPFLYCDHRDVIYRIIDIARQHTDLDFVIEMVTMYGALIKLIAD